jgi:hypothetical protein
MEIAIFESVVVESALTELEAEGKKYDGLYVDMEDAPQRKYVKDKAALVQALKKKVDRVRIDAAKTYKLEVESQAAAIHERLDTANAAFQILIDDYTLERKKILDAEKARKQAIIDLDLFNLDHEMALLIDKTYAYDQAEMLRLHGLEMARILAEAEVKSTERQERVNAAQERDKINAENARLADVEHVRGYNRAIFSSFIQSGLEHDAAKIATQALIDNKIQNVTINY